jgi:anti-anti-sigma factor
MTTASAPLEVGLDARLDDGAWVVAVRGKVDILSVGQLAAVLQACAKGRNRLVVDLSQVDSFGAAALGTIANVARQLNDAGGTLTVRVGSALVQRMFEVADLGALVDLTRADSDPAAASEFPWEDAATTVLRTLTASRPPLAHDILVVAAMTMLGKLGPAVIHSVEASSVTMNRGGSFVTVAATDRVAVELDERQYSSRAGPCVRAAMQGHVVHAHASSEVGSWAIISAPARRAGINAVLSTPIREVDTPIGALNLYSSNDEFTNAERARALALVRDVATFVDERRPPSSHVIDRLGDALTSRELLTLAQGVLMERNRISADDAFTLLQRRSRASGWTLRDVAEAVINDLPTREPLTLPKDEM